MSKTTIGTCQTCRYWARNKPPEHNWNESALFGHCSNPRLRYGEVESEIVILREDWNRPGTEYAELPAAEATSMLIYEDDEGYQAFLATGQDFGCIHWEARVV